MIAELLRAVDWINPLTWLAARRLRTESELACDDVVLSTGVPAHEYAGDLHRARPPCTLASRACRTRRVGDGAAEWYRKESRSHVERWTGPVSRDASLARARRRAAAHCGPSRFRYGLSAQSLSSLSGVVFDPQNLGVPRATVSLTETRTEARHEVRSDATGRYEFVGLHAGRLPSRGEGLPGFAALTGPSA